VLLRFKGDLIRQDSWKSVNTGKHGVLSLLSRGVLASPSTEPLCVAICDNVCFSGVSQSCACHRVMVPYRSNASERRQTPTPIPYAGRQMPMLICPKCQSTNVKPVTVWHVASTGLNITAPPRPMFACQELFCLHKWARQPNVEAVRLQTKWKNQGDQSCEHSTQRLINVAPADSGPARGLFYCEACGTEFVRPYEPFE
jgi:hypothetical protein